MRALLATGALALPSLAWLATFRPGLMSADSLVVWSWAGGEPASDWHPPLYLLLMYLSRLTVGSPAGLAAVQCLLLAAGVAALAHRVAVLTTRRALAWATAGVVAASPMYGAFSISLWKDVPFTAVGLLTAERLVVIATRREGRAWPLAHLGGLCVLLVLFRQNGAIFVAAIGAALLVVRAGWKRSAAVVALPAVALLVAKAIVYPAANIAPAPSRLALAPTLLDVGAVVHADRSALTASEARAISRVQPIEAWAQGYACHTVDPLLFNTTFDGVALDRHRGEYVSAWLSMVRRHPGIVLRSRLCTADPVYMAGPFGQRADMFTVPHGVDPNGQGLETDPVLDGAHRAASAALRWMDHPDREWLLWRAPLWAYLLVAVWALQRLRRRNPWPFVSVAFPLLFLASAGVLSLAPDARYTFGALLSSVLLLPLALGPRPSPEAPASAPACESAEVSAGPPPAPTEPALTG